jgi:ATP-dependent DNA helicase RecQ
MNGKKFLKKPYSIMLTKDHDYDGDGEDSDDDIVAGGQKGGGGDEALYKMLKDLVVKEAKRAKLPALRNFSGNITGRDVYQLPYYD